MKFYSKTDVGLVRTNNEDSFLTDGGKHPFAIVADGMGGHNAGEVASGIAIQTFADSLRAAARPSVEEIHKGVRLANSAVYAEASKDVSKHGMGTTLTGVWFDRSTALVCNVGDSRAYLWRNGALVQITSDHSLVNEMVMRGEITPKEALTHPQRNIITRTVGVFDETQPDVFRVQRQKNDVWLLCSDGLTNHVRSVAISNVLSGHRGTWQEKVNSLVELALEAGGSDNITCVLVTEEAEG